MAINFDALYRQAQADLDEQKDIARKSDTPVLDKLMQAWGTGIEEKERLRVRKEERSEDAMKIMALQAGDYGANYDNTSLDVNIKRLENYVAKNKGKFDATAMDYYDVTLNGLRDQKALNIDFKSYQERLPGEVEKMNKYLQGRDKDQVWTAENINELKDMQAPLANFLGEFKAKHGNRLATKSYEDYDLQLDNMKSMDSFLIQSALDDGHLDEREATSFIIDLEQGNTKASDRYNKLEDVKIGSQIKELTARMGTQMAEIDMLKKFKAGEGAIPIDAEGNYDPQGQAGVMTWAELSLDLQNKKLSQGEIDKRHAKFDQLITSKIDAAKISDKSYQTLTTEGSYIGGIAPDLLTPIVPKKPPGEPPKKVVITTVKSATEKSRGLTGKRSDLIKLRKAEKQGGSYLEQALKHLGYESKESLEKEIVDITINKAKLPAMKYVQKELISIGVTDKNNINKWIKNNQKEWEDRVNREYEKRSKAGQYR